MSTASSLGDDNVFIARKDIFVGEVLASGNSGKVYRGTFKGAVVAVKQPSVRLHQLDYDVILSC